MAIQQFVFGLYAEGRSDDRFFPALFERYFGEFTSENGIDAEFIVTVLPDPDIERDSLFEILAALEGEYQPSIFLLHRDADHRDESRVIQRMWEPWMQRCREPERWLPVIPVRMMEAWQLCDVDALAAVFRTNEQVVQEKIGHHDPERVQDPKEVIRALGRQNRRRRISDYQELLAKRISFEHLQRLDSFQRFHDRLQEMFAPIMR